MIRAVDASPDGQYFRVTRMVEPFSYIVPVAQLRFRAGVVGRDRQGGRHIGQDAAA